VLFACKSFVWAQNAENRIHRIEVQGRDLDNLEGKSAKAS